MQKLYLIFSLLLSLVLVADKCFAFENNVYIWQRSWRAELKFSIDQTSQVTGKFKILAGDLKIENKHIAFSKVAVNWEYLRPSNGVEIDIRMRTDLSRFLAAKDQKDIVEYLIHGINDVINEAQASGVEIKSIELDYDCPTSKLSDFARFLKILRAGLPNKIISITALPTWLGSSDFLSLLSATDYYVLQLHSFDLPKNKDTQQYIFPKDRAVEYYNRASALGHQFYISLPTYGYEVAYSKDDEFIGLRAEGAIQYFADGIKKKMLFTEPKAIVEYLEYLGSSKSEVFRGVCWFRLPVESDRFNWDIKTFQRVIKREIPKAHLQIVLERKDDGLIEVYLLNDGEIAFPDKVSFEILWSGESPIFDVLGDFDYSYLQGVSGICLTGKAPRVSQRKMAAWFRAASNIKEIDIRKGKVLIDEKH